MMTTHFLYPKIRVSALIFLNYSSQAKIRYLRQSLSFYNNWMITVRII